jgi:glycosyltransferase involved in cell wall biosynthesis
MGREAGPHVSIVTPSWNHEPYIAACLDSVQAQSWDDWELMVIDDGSEDATAEIVEAYARDDDRIRLLRMAHRGLEGLGESYNRALDLTSGALVAVLEGDDLWPDPQKLALQVAVFR